ncbi:PTS fructose transporter subunit IIABC [Williamsoniiplasma lucivorax]|uniref:PTS system, fructose-specific IIABC component n=1 Tax=Williamsoniiplasma lucivorax TaxID=209274 RepID=A0A2S5REX0_9MOLU|nr:fructose-specific PTS transporter subunit EIIC [Williamsoniiplasma lucivorax]PPE05762.1 PTS system, fructose-specific IIABC component [Williamsoniiplasma lucivorax]
MNLSIFNKDFIFLDVEIKDQQSAFKFMADQAATLKLILAKDKKALILGFENREKQGTTGFEDGFAIPHARIPEIKNAAVLVFRFKNAIEWESMDGKPTKVAIALLVPEGPNGDEHLAILSQIAVKLMDDGFKKTLKTTKTQTAILKAFETKKEEKKQEVSNTNQDQLNIVAITACVVGIAHTYMAEERLLKEVPKMGYNIRVETQGSKGIGTQLTTKEIEQADLVIFATDTNIDKERFVGKKFYQTKVSDAIKNPEAVVKEAIAKGTIIQNGKGSFDNSRGKAKADSRMGLIQHILAGISYMIPIIVLGGIALAFSIGLAKAIWGPDASTSGPASNPGLSPWGPLAVLDKIGGAAFALMIPILAGFIANSIAGRAAIAPAMVGAFIGNNTGNLMVLPGMDKIETPMGFIGALIAGILVGYFVRWINTWNVPKSLRPAMPIFFIPLIAGIGISLIFIYVLGGPIGWIMHQFSNAIKHAYESSTIGVGLGLGLGIVLGAMAGFDMGGPINKIAFVTSTALITAGIQQPMGAMAAGIPVAPLAMGISTLVFPRFYNKDERGLGIAAIIMGTIGISEGAIPFALRDPRRAIVCNVLGSAVAGGIAGAFMITDAAGHGGPIVAILGAVPYGAQTAYYFLAVAIGVIVTVASYGLWVTIESGAEKSVREAHNIHVSQLRSDKKDRIQEIKKEINNIKHADKLAKKETGNDIKSTDKIEVLKAQIVKINDDFKDVVNKNKLIMKEIEIAEKASIKDNKANIKTANTNINIATKEAKASIQSVKGERSKLDQLADIKENKREKRLAVQTQYRQQFVDQYNKQIVA